MASKTRSNMEEGCHCEERSDAAIHAVRSHGLLHFVRNDGRVVTASEARQSMQPEVMDCFTAFAMTAFNWQ